MVKKHQAVKRERAAPSERKASSERTEAKRRTKRQAPSQTVFVCFNILGSYSVKCFLCVVFHPNLACWEALCSFSMTTLFSIPQGHYCDPGFVVSWVSGIGSYFRRLAASGLRASALRRRRTTGIPSTRADGPTMKMRNP